MPIKRGDRIPRAKLKAVTPAGTREVVTDDLFAGRRVVLFAVPGAFSPTCSEQHLPGFVERAEELKAAGADEVVCVAVNDAFVLKAWAEHAKVGDRVTMLADGNADFTRALGMELDATGFGMGTRSLRYAMVVDDGEIRVLAVEESPALAEASTADAMVAALKAM
jgi:glutaredoxin/glutathione-dependent peroxiredoxin